jgi:ribonuclease P protein subunit POP4
MMRITADNVYAHELIGMYVNVVESSNYSLNGINGRVVYESKNMLYISNDYKHIKMIPKKGSVLEFLLGDGTRCIVKGNDLIGRPEDRIEKIG